MKHLPLLLVILFSYSVVGHCQSTNEVVSEIGSYFSGDKNYLTTEFGDLNFVKVDNVVALENSSLTQFYAKSKLYYVDLHVEQFGMPIVLTCPLVFLEGDLALYAGNDEAVIKTFIEALGKRQLNTDEYEEYSKALFDFLKPALIETRPQDCSDCQVKSSKLLAEVSAGHVLVQQLTTLEGVDKVVSEFPIRTVEFSFSEGHLDTIEPK
jgi:hypothetical protein